MNFADSEQRPGSCPLRVAARRGVRRARLGIWAVVICALVEVRKPLSFVSKRYRATHPPGRHRAPSRRAVAASAKQY